MLISTFFNTNMNINTFITTDVKLKLGYSQREITLHTLDVLLDSYQLCLE